MYRLEENRDIIYIALGGPMLSLAFFFIIEIGYAQFMLDFVISQIELGGTSMLLLIFLGGDLIATLICLVIGFIISERVKRIRKVSVIMASIMTLLCNLFFWGLFPYFPAYIYYPEIFSEVVGIEIIFVLPEVYCYFGIYILNDIVMLWILKQLSYFLFLALFLKIFYLERRGVY